MSNLTINNPANPSNASQPPDASSTGDGSAQWSAVVAAQKAAGNGSQSGEPAATNNGIQPNETGASNNGTQPGETGTPAQAAAQKPEAGSHLSLWAHGVLTAGSFFPSVFGSAFSAVDAALYHVEGDDTNAAISFGAAAAGLVTDAGAAKLVALGVNTAAKALKAGAAVKAGAVATKAMKVGAATVNVGKDASNVTKAGEALVKAGKEGDALGALRLPRAVGADVVINISSKVGQSTYATKLAQKLSAAAQRDVDGLLFQLKSGNANPGIGTRSLGNRFFELRGRNGGRVIIKRTSASSFDIVGKFQGHVRGDDANSAIIKKLIEDYKPSMG